MSDNRRSPKDDPAFFVGLFEQYKNFVFKTAFFMLGESGEAEEALQEVFVLVYRSLAQYDPQKGALSTWLHRITVNYCLRRRQTRRFDSFTFKDEESMHSSSIEEPGFSGMAEREVMLQAIRRLSEKHQVVVILRYYWDLPYSEIAQVLEIPLGTVKSRLDQAVHSLRQILTGPDGTEKSFLPQGPVANEEGC